MSNTHNDKIRGVGETAQFDDHYTDGDHKRMLDTISKHYDIRPFPSTVCTDKSHRRWLPELAFTSAADVMGAHDRIGSPSHCEVICRTVGVYSSVMAAITALHQYDQHDAISVHTRLFPPLDKYQVAVNILAGMVDELPVPSGIATHKVILWCEIIEKPDGSIDGWVQELRNNSRNIGAVEYSREG